MNNNFNQSVDCLSNFVGALVSSSSLEGMQTRHHVVSILCSEILKLSKQDDRHNSYILKPLIKTNLIILESWIKDLEILTDAELGILDEKELSTLIAQKTFYADTIKGFKKMIDNIEKGSV